MEMHQIHIFLFLSYNIKKKKQTSNSLDNEVETLHLQLGATKIPQSLQNTDTASGFSIRGLLKATTVIPENLRGVGRFTFNLFQRD